MQPITRESFTSLDSTKVCDFSDSAISSKSEMNIGSGELRPFVRVNNGIGEDIFLGEAAEREHWTVTFVLNGGCTNSAIRAFC
ncbi:hypothetical protein C7378_1755 [Acidipila rosea]|uniref:Uncharacterized protein n=1 Tax=Acidipila rosea TaxID=768535 RepID=A0A4R1LB43_9BACT|nr:hypothetical protein C7378_1755 [Acidipila rosea]